MAEHDPRKCAEECFRQARTALNDADKLMFLDMAQAWLALAGQRETITALGMTADSFVAGCSRPEHRDPIAGEA